MIIDEKLTEVVNLLTLVLSKANELPNTTEALVIRGSINLVLGALRKGKTAELAAMLIPVSQTLARMPDKEKPSNIITLKDKGGLIQ